MNPMFNNHQTRSSSLIFNGYRKTFTYCHALDLVEIWDEDSQFVVNGELGKQIYKDYKKLGGVKDMDSKQFRKKLESLM